jgi:hypothetical protein
VRLGGITAFSRRPQALDSSLDVLSIRILLETGLPMLLLKLQQLLLCALELAPSAGAGRCGSSQRDCRARRAS